jgi:hypothetical protein
MNAMFEYVITIYQKRRENVIYWAPENSKGAILRANVINSTWQRKMILTLEKEN